ncbi:MAG: cell division protein FtsX [Bacteroidia bacterium]|nr:MAG: cell division protein FtsX [Bacteroidia bacterium]
MKHFNPSSITVIISLSLVLFMLGITSMVLYNAQKLTLYVKENIGFQIYLKDSIPENNLNALQNELAQMPFTKEIKYISKESAADQLKKDLGEDFISFLGYNPLSSMIEIKLNADYANNDSLQKIERTLSDNPYIKEITYQKNLIDKINKNTRIIIMYLSLFAILLLVVAVALINNTIRLTIYSQRFLIRTMYLVGATKFFIGKPFIVKSVLQGLIASLVSSLMIVALWYISIEYIPQISVLQNTGMWLVTFASVLFSGILIAALSAWASVSYYLRLQYSDLYL